MRIVAVSCQKGGPGKTTTTMNLAAAVSKYSRTLVVDTDPQGSTSWWATNAGDTLPFDFAADVDPNNLARLRELPYDVVFVDTPGNLEAEAVLTAVLDAADFAIVPLAPSPLDVPATMRTIKRLIEPRGVAYRILLNKIDRRRGAAHLEEWEQLVDNGLKLPRFAGHVRLVSALIDAPLSGKVVTDLTDTRANQAAIFDYTRVAHELQSIWANGRD